MSQRNSLIIGLIPHFIEKGVVALQYADDTIICLQDNKEKALNLWLLLYLYETMLGLKINFQKSEILMVQHDDQKANFMLNYLIV